MRLLGNVARHNGLVRGLLGSGAADAHADADGGSGGAHWLWAIGVWQVCADAAVSEWASQLLLTLCEQMGAGSVAVAYEGGGRACLRFLMALLQAAGREDGPCFVLCPVSFVLCPAEKGKHTRTYAASCSSGRYFVTDRNLWNDH